MAQTFFNKAIQQTVEDVFDAALDPKICGYNRHELALRAGLSPTTVYNLHSRKTRDPRYSTILKLCRAVSMDEALAREQLGLSPMNRRVRRSRKAWKVVG